MSSSVQDGYWRKRGKIDEMIYHVITENMGIDVLRVTSDKFRYFKKMFPGMISKGPKNRRTVEGILRAYDRAHQRHTAA